MTKKPLTLRQGEHHAGGLFELEITTVWELVDPDTQEILWQISSEATAHYDGVGWDPETSGSVSQVTLDPEGRGVLVFYSGNPEPHLMRIESRK